MYTYLETQESDMASKIDVLAANFARRGFLWPRRFPMLCLDNWRISRRILKVGGRSRHTEQKLRHQEQMGLGSSSTMKREGQIVLQVPLALVLILMIMSQKIGRRIKRAYNDAARATDSQAHHSEAVCPTPLKPSRKTTPRPVKILLERGDHAVCGVKKTP